jgi:Phage-related lysozyme (muraminidase)
MRHVDDRTIALLKHFESLHDGDKSTPLLEAVRDPVGYWTQGWGHLVTKDLTAPEPPPITMAQADEWLFLDLAIAERAVLRLCPVALTNGQFGALVDFAYNLGAGNLQVSALRQKVLRGEHDAAAQEFGKWIRAGGRIYRGLVLRREAERRLYLAVE